MSKSVRIDRLAKGADIRDASRNVQAFKQRNQEIPADSRDQYETNDIGVGENAGGTPWINGLKDKEGTYQTQYGTSQSATLRPGWDHLADMSSELPEEKRVQTMAYYNEGKYPKGDNIMPYNKQAGPGSQGKVLLDDGFFDFLQKKKELELWNHYESFKMALVDTKDEPLREWWKRHHPDLWKKKMQAYEDMLEVKKKFDYLMFAGANSEEDLRWLYLASINSNMDTTGVPLSFNALDPKAYAPTDNMMFKISQDAKTGIYNYQRRPF